MIYIVTCLDRAGASALRLEHIEAHRAYLAKAPIRTLISGPLVEADGTTMKGSFFMLEVQSREEVERFQQDDPLYKAGIWETRIVEAFFKRVDNLSPPPART
jgi:uncharacterized protein YciI